MHLVLDSAAGHVKAFNEDGSLWSEFPMHDAAVNGPGFGFRGRCPRGTYTLGRPVCVHDVSMGRWFTPLMEVPHRDGIGIHAGGSGLLDPFAARQPLVMTLGCLRVHNEDNDRLAPEIERRQDAGEPCRVTVAGP